jgi:membrane glycosyltransferase
MKYCGYLYLLTILALALLLTFLLARMINWQETNRVISALWIAGFFCMILNLTYTVIMTICSFFIKAQYLPEAHLSHIPKTAILYVIKNEDIIVKDRMESTLAFNRDANIDLWLISNSDDVSKINEEQFIVTYLQDRFVGTNIRYYRPHNNPLGRKHVAIRQWISDNDKYEYFIVCDADTVLCPGMLHKLISKAEHPQNKEIMAFQSHMEVEGSVTRFAKYMEPGQNLVEKTFRRVNYHFWGLSPYYGHSALIRGNEFGQLKIPDFVLSHDLWETAAIDAAHSRLALCEDAVSMELLPSVPEVDDGFWVHLRRLHYCLGRACLSQ